MAYLSSLPDRAVLADVLRAYPDLTRPLLDYHEILLRGPSPFTTAERELIAAYVSGVNSCDYCQGVHTVAAEACGLAAGAAPAAVADLDSAPVSDKLKPVLRYVGKLTRTPAAVSKADAEEVLAAGWDERALVHAVLVCALFNFMNRVVEGLGVSADEDYYAMSGTRLHDIGYAGLSAMLHD
jgi:uncharacterized peroxidase-related enzyme